MATFELREMREFRPYFHGFLLGMQVERKRHTKKRKALRFLLKLGHDDQFVWKRSVGKIIENICPHKFAHECSQQRYS